MKVLSSLHSKLSKQTHKFQELYQVLEAEAHYKKEFIERKKLLNVTNAKYSTTAAEANVSFLLYFWRKIK